MQANKKQRQAPTATSDQFDDADDLSSVASEQFVLAQNEHRAVQTLRLLVLVVLVIVAVVVSVSVFLYSRNQEEETFEKTFSEQAGKVVDAFQANAEKRLTALQGFSQQITSYALYANQTFPFVTLPDIERQGQYILKLAEVVGMIVYPLVSTEQRSEWEAYSVAHQGWLKEGLALQEARNQQIAGASNNTKDEQELNNLQEKYDNGKLIADNETDTYHDELLISPVIFRVEPGTVNAGVEPGPGPFAPFWTCVPAIPISILVNFNSFSHPSMAPYMATLMKTESIVISGALDFRDNNPLVANRKDVLNLFLNRWRAGEYEYEDGPVSDVYIPIYNGYGPDKKMAAFIVSFVYWQGYFAHVLPESAHGILAILSNTCNESFTFEINGEDVVYVGKGDRHDAKYNHLGVETGYGAFLPLNNNSSADANEGAQCHFKLSVYPSQQTEDDYVTSQPMIFTFALVFIFMFTSLVYIAYDFFVSRRHKVVKSTAVKSSKVVSSLFPEAVRDRLYDTTDKKKVGRKASLSHWESATKEGGDTGGDVEIDDSMPIADLYPNCTVFFADIAGFTAWSSQRQPTQVFKLLETLYGAFDKIAKKRRVFKIETIGDCYVAVTGLPYPQEDHAITMVLFASECLIKMNELLLKLVERLGEDTASLSMRAGLHSGPVTAGVLRGEKARFQLFGDTVNTAARMESNGQRGRIHVSEATANNLVQAGKSDWVRKRDDLIEAKGKGTMQTYWVEPNLDHGNSVRTGQTDISSTAELEIRLTSYLAKSQNGSFNKNDVTETTFLEL